MRRCCSFLTALLLTTPLTASAADARLSDLIRTADLTAIRAALPGADVNGADADGSTPLHWAVQRDDERIVELLIRAGANVTAANRYQVTPLTVACTNGNATIVSLLLQAGADPNAAAADGETALMTAARTGKVDVVGALIARGANVNAKEGWRGQTALMWAAIENNAAAAQALIEGGADLAARSQGGFTALLFASRGGHVDTARVLVAAGAKVDEKLPDGTSPLVLATINAHYELASWLLDHGADANAAEQGWTALHQLAWTRRPNKGFANPGPVSTGSIDSLELVEILVKHGADVNARQTKEPRDGYRNMLDRTGATPFLLAAKSADVDLMRALLAQGADPLLPTKDNSTPLMVAAGVGIWNVGENPGTNDEALEAVKLIFGLGGVVTAANDNGYTALHGAAHRGANDLVTWLVEKGASLDAKLTKPGGGSEGTGGWRAGWTPLTIAEGVFYAAAFKAHPETAALLRQLMKAPSP